MNRGRVQDETPSGSNLPPAVDNYPGPTNILRTEKDESFILWRIIFAVLRKLQQPQNLIYAIL